MKAPRSCTVRGRKSKHWVDYVDRAHICPTNYGCDCHEEEIFIEVQDEDEWAMATLPVKRARKLFEAGLKMCDKIEKDATATQE
jgi:hypothetical protein